MRPGRFGCRGHRTDDPDPGAPPLFNERRGRREIARGRLRQDVLTRGQVQLSDAMVDYLGRHFSPEDVETVGRGLLIAASAAGSLVTEGVSQAQVIVNILGFAGDRMIGEGAAWLAAQTGSDDDEGPGHAEDL